MDAFINGFGKETGVPVYSLQDVLGMIQMFLDSPVMEPGEEDPPHPECPDVVWDKLTEVFVQGQDDADPPLDEDAGWDAWIDEDDSEDTLFCEYEGSY